MPRRWIRSSAALRRFPASVPLRLLALDVYRYSGRQEDVPGLMEDLERVVMGSPQRFATPEGRVALGRYFLLRGRRFPQGARPLL